MTNELPGNQYTAATMAQAACGMDSTKARHDKLLNDLDLQERILRELLDELRELNRSAA